MTKSEKRIPFSEYTSNEWYYKQLADDWYYADHDAETNEMIMRRMSENGYGDITPQQASIMKYGSIYELDKNQLRTLLGKRYDEAVFKDWDDVRQKPLEEYKAWLNKK